MKQVGEDLDKSDIYFEESRMDDNSTILMPLIALKSSPCSWLKNCGGCTTCGYQLAASLSQIPTDENLIHQTEHAIKRLPANTYPLITFNGAGNLLDPAEIGDDIREELLKMLKMAGYKEFNFESRPEYVLSEKRLQQLKKYFDIVSVGIGLESKNDYIRNNVIHKGTKLNTYLSAIKTLNKYNIDGDVYIQIGKPFLSAKEDIEDAVETATFAFENGFTRVFLMTCNIQPSTLTHYMWKEGLYKPPMLWSAIEVIKRLPEKYRSNAYVKGFNRAIPTPMELPQNCPKCTGEVADKLIHWNLTGDYGFIEEMPKCDCQEKFKKLLDEKADKALEERVEEVKKMVEEDKNIG